MANTDIFNSAVEHVMTYEVGSNFQLTLDVEAGLIDTRAQRQAVGYTIDPTDRGGETKFGIAKNANPDTDIASLTWNDAKDIYYQKYWLATKCDQLPDNVAILAFDTSVNNGVSRASKFLQRAVNVQDDGIIGDGTIDAVNNVDPSDICSNICDQRENFYRAIVKAHPEQSKYLNGWLRRVNEMREFVKN